MPHFDEETFIYALSTRPEDARRFAFTFRPNWLEKAEYTPILAEIYAFTKKQGEPPSLTTLHKIFEKKDADSYQLRYKEVLDKLQTVEPDRSEQLFVLEQAKGVAVTRSLMEMVQDQGFIKKQSEFNGTAVIKDIQKWLSQFSDTGEDRTMDLRSAVEALMDTAEFIPTNVRIPCHIKPLDDWTGGGLRKRQLAIVIAPTGHGKSALLLVLGHKIAAVEHKKVWLITNELVMEEVVERELSRLTGQQVNEIMDDPTIAYKGLDRHWGNNLDKRFMISEFNRETSVDDLEAELAKMSNLYGWKPDVIVLDYMERMKPSVTGMRRDSEWVWLGFVAKDLVRMAKRHNILIWTAAQTNRSGLASDDIDMSMAQSSIRHLQEATAVIAMNQVEIPGTEEVVLKLKPLKMRQSKRAVRAVNLKCDLSRMSISNEEVETNMETDEEEAGGSDSSTAQSPRQRQRAKRRGR